MIVNPARGSWTDPGIRRSLPRIAAALIPLLLLPVEAVADWGDDWGAFSWGSLAPAPVPFGTPFGALLLFGLLVAVASAWLARHPQARTLATTVAVIGIPLTAWATTISMPNVFSNGTVADANEVNQNFDVIVTESNAQDVRIGALESSQGDISQVDAGTGLLGGGGAGAVTLEADTNYLQRRVVGGCADNQHVASISATGVVTCASNSADVSSVSAGTGLFGGGAAGSIVLSHADTSSQSSINGSLGTVVQDVFLDTFGHVSSLATTNLDGRYFTESESISNFVDSTGDTMTGSLTVEAPFAYYYADSSSTWAGYWFQENGVNKYRLLSNSTTDDLTIYNYTAGGYAMTVDGPTNRVDFQSVDVSGMLLAGSVDVSGTLFAGYEVVTGSAAALSSSTTCSVTNSGTCYYASTTVSCPTGKVAVGGGCNCNSSYNCYIGDSHISGTSAWTCRGVAGRTGYSVTPSVQCARLAD